MKADETWRWLELWERARERALTVEEQSRLNAALRDDPAVRALLAQAAVLDAELNAMEALAEAPPRALAARPPLWRRLVLPAAAALVSAGLVWLWEKPPAPVAVLAKASACKWGNSALPTLEGSDLQPGLLELVDGIATLKFRSGAEVTLEAPVTLSGSSGSTPTGRVRRADARRAATRSRRRPSAGLAERSHSVYLSGLRIFASSARRLSSMSDLPRERTSPLR